MPQPENQYESAIKWIENEVHSGGVVEIQRAMADNYDRKSGITRQCPTGRLVGFSCSSQRTSGQSFNLLQLVSEMRGDLKLDAKKARSQFKKMIRKLKHAYAHPKRLVPRK